MNSLGDSLNKFGFIVNKKANKLQIKKAVEDMYGVSVTEVNTIRYGSKLKTRFTKGGVIAGRTNGIKKAIITVKDGETIDFYSNI